MLRLRQSYFCLLSFLLIFFVFGTGFFSKASSQDNIPLIPPVNFLVTVLSGNYAYLTWSPSESGARVAGYYIYLNGQRLTRTTELFYLDQNLSPNTNYRYHLTVYDTYGNESAPTSLVVIKTPPTSVAQSKKDQLKGIEQITFRLDNFEVSPSFDQKNRSLIITFDTNKPSLASLRYGKDDSLSLGLVQGINATQTHSYIIDNLPKSEQYYLEIKLNTGTTTGELVLSRVFINGRIFGDIFYPNDIVDLTISSKDNAVVFNWSPLSNNSTEVYIVRSDRFYPVTRFFGLPVWQGRGTNYTDVNLKYNQNYYYGFFVCDQDKICSPGMYAVVYLEVPDKLKLLTATTSALQAKRQCQQRNIFSGDRFTLGTIVNKENDQIRLCLARLIKDEQVISSYQLFPQEDYRFETSALSISEPGIYRYEIECYDAYGAGLQKMSCGEITVPSFKTETNLFLSLKKFLSRFFKFK